MYPWEYRMNGLLHIYYGDGKGKTTAATGLAVRGAGDGKSILFCRFLKTENSSELPILDQIENIDVVHLKKSFGFYKFLGEKEKEEVKDFYRTLWEEIVEKAMSGKYNMMIMDEIIATCNHKIVLYEELIHFLREKPSELEVVMTGRNPSQELVDMADYVSEIRKIKHPFDRGIAARKGIEY